MNSKWGNSLTIIVGILCVFSLESYSPWLSGFSYIQKPEGGGPPQGVSAFCVAELAELVVSLPPLPPGRVNIVPCTSVHSLRSAQPFRPGP